MSQAQPVIPPRPQRSQAAAETQNVAQIPQVPPRPASKRIERSVSPANYPHSPLNQPYGTARSRNSDPIQRPPSVSRLPMSGEEGMEYGEISSLPQPPISALATDAVAQTRQISDDLPMHAPKPSLPTTSATAQVQAVTRTDSTSAVGHGIGRPPSQDGEPLGRTRSRASFSRPDSAASGDRRRSMYGDDQYGPAEIGIRVPINPLLGDVQAPSPAPGLSPHHTGGQHTENRKRQHHRTKSGREVFLPPGSYGLHGHGVPVTDKFEKDWYAKHPEQAEQEEGHGHGVYESIGSGRGSFALSSDDLNKIVRSTASGGHGFGTSGKVVSYPDEQIGYMASEQYQSRQTTPAQTPGLHKSASISDPVAQSPLRKASVPAQDEPSEQTLDPVHVDAPARRYNKVTGGQGTLTDKEEVKPYITHPTEKNGLTNEHGYSVPILAEDEVAKVVGFEHLQPAVSPVQQRRGSSNYDEYGNELPPRPSSRPGSIYNLHSASNSLSRFHSHHEDREHMHTPLEDVDEYEPLFPEDDKKKAISAADRFKRRPDSLRHKFPSQDIWEDTPSSAMYEATVSTPDLPQQVSENERTDNKTITTSTFETPAAEAARKGEASEEEKKKLIPAEERLLKSKFAPHLRDDMPTRPGMQPRFPSQDVWEDSPDSQSLYTTVNEPEPEPEAQKSPVETKPVIPTRPAKSRLGEGASSSQIAPSVEPSAAAQQEKTVHAVPPIDAKLTDTTVPLSKEASPTELRKVPSIPDRPKPQIPARPKKADTETLSKVTSASSQDSTETERAVGTSSAAKAKPQVPARPQGSKIANLRSTFMNDLNTKLGMGPPKEKEPEPEAEAEPEEVKPLEDARKSRARGPQRRAPAKSPSAPTQKMSFAISKPQSLWHIDEQNSLNVPVAKAQPQLSSDKMEQIEHSTPADAPLPPTLDTTAKVNTEAEKRPDDAPKALAPSLASNMAGEYVDPAPVSAETHASSGTHAQSTLPEKDLSTGVLEQTSAVDEERIHATERDPAI